MNNDRSNMSNREGAKVVACACGQGQSAVVQAEGAMSIVRSRVGRVLLASALAVLFTATVTAFSQVHPAFADDAAYQKAVEEEVADGGFPPDHWDDAAEEGAAAGDETDGLLISPSPSGLEADEIALEPERVAEEEVVEEEVVVDGGFPIDSLADGDSATEAQTDGGFFPPDPDHPLRSDDSATEAQKDSGAASEHPDALEDEVPSITLTIGDRDDYDSRSYNVACEGFEPESLDIVWCGVTPVHMPSYFYSGYEGSKGLRIDIADANGWADNGMYYFVVVARDSSGALVASAPETLIINDMGLVRYSELESYWESYYGWKFYHNHIEPMEDWSKPKSDDAAENVDNGSAVHDDEAKDTVDADEQSILQKMDESSDEVAESDEDVDPYWIIDSTYTITLREMYHESGVYYYRVSCTGFEASEWDFDLLWRDVLPGHTAYLFSDDMLLIDTCVDGEWPAEGEYPFYVVATERYCHWGIPYTAASNLGVLVFDYRYANSMREQSKSSHSVNSADNAGYIYDSTGTYPVGTHSATDRGADANTVSSSTFAPYLSSASYVVADNRIAQTGDAASAQALALAGLAAAAAAAASIALAASRRRREE